MADAMWSMDVDSGEFTLNEPYRTMLEEARVEATRGWYAGLVSYLAPRCDYTEQELRAELLRRNEEHEGGKVDIFESFVLDALSGDL